MPIQPERNQEARIRFAGTAVQPVSAMIGLESKKLITFDPNGPIDLGFVHQLSSVKPVIYLTADDKHFNLREAVPDVNSVLFELLDHKFEKLAVINPIQINTRKKERLVLTLKPKKKLKIGILRELIKIRLGNDVELYMPITCRIVGNVYVGAEIIHLGNLTKTSPKEFAIYFTDKTEAWPDLKWDIKGYLSDAIIIREDDSGRTNSHIGLTLDVNQPRLSSLPKGYVFCRIKLYQNRPTDDDVVSVLVDGFNIKPDI